MITQRAKMDVVTNDIANMDTVGFKSDEMISRSFSDMLLNKINDPDIVNQRQEVGPLSTGTHIDQVFTDFSPGPLEETDQQTDLALQGDGFFAVSTPQGVRYTRSGNFTVNSNGYLVTQEGYYVLGQGGGNLKVGTGDFSVAGDGTITAGGQSVGKLRLVTFQNLTDLRKTGNNLYTTYNNAQPVDATNPDVKQGWQETSNVDMSTVMVDMMSTERNYQSNQQVVKMVDETLDQTVNNIAKF
jgi:flagellar basal-body rod protein FlgF